MANLRDIRTRINSVITTKQVTSAMKMVSAAKLKKAQEEVSNIRPYSDNMSELISRLAKSSPDREIDFAKTPTKGEKETIDKTLIIAMASNRGLCGAFNSNVVKEVQLLLADEYKEDYKSGNVYFHVLGRQIEKQFKSRNIKVDGENHDLLEKINYSNASEYAESLMKDYIDGKFNKIIVVYNEFRNAAVQIIKTKQFLPFTLEEYDEYAFTDEYIYEPDVKTIITEMIPKMLKVSLFRILLESQASEHGARMTSMHKATDNAEELIKDLQLGYNKARQASITNQIVEITGGAEALKG